MIELLIYIIGIILLLFLGGLFLFGLIIMWMVCQGFKANDSLSNPPKFNEDKIEK